MMHYVGRGAVLLLGIGVGMVSAQTCGADNYVCNKVQECTGGDAGYCRTMCYPTEGGETGCYNHYTDVEYHAATGKCLCTCSNQWEGDRCNTCPPEFGGADCNECATGRIGFPNCRECGQSDCNNHAASVGTDAAKTKCECQCADYWTGDKCGSCPADLDQASCDKCREGYYGTAPNCQQCSVQSDCQGRASAVTSNAARTGCECTCKDQWEGASCGNCPNQFEQTECKSCAAGRIGYPQCTHKCQAADCNNHATTVGTNGAQTACTCQCEARYAGATCDQCASGFEGYGNGCNECTAGSVGFPNCRLCTNQADCNNRAKNGGVATNGAKDACTCDCSNSWTGDQCETCPAKFNEQAGCSKCAPGRITYPTCEQCTNAQHCNGRAKQNGVGSNGAGTRCTCQCEEAFGGDECEQCGTGYFGSYPNCVKCDSATGCNGHADSATPNAQKTACECQCSAGFEGASCDKCADGYINYPQCTQCTSATHCSNHADAVTSNQAKTGCECSCRKQWTGATCDSCDTNLFDQNADCGQCAQGRVGYPTCRQCTINADCTSASRADSVDSNNNHNKCVCSCKARFGGQDCSQCSAAFEGANCDSCAAGYIGYPNCERCTSQQHCNGHAKSVDDDGSRSSCVCDCDKSWTGADCNTCDTSKYEENQNCGQCVAGRINYPNCEVCDVSTHCNNRASQVTSNNQHNSCVCTCDTGFGGNMCQDCAAGYFGTAPNCIQCTSQAFCNNHADKATPDAGQTKCECQCSAAFEGETCDSCAAGYIDYAAGCTQCTQQDCSNHAKTISSNQARTACECQCRKQWTGATCDKCDTNLFDETADCGQCAQGRVGYPTCRQCTVNADCGGASRATAVDSNAQHSACECTCKPGFAGATCDTCANGYVNHPQCTKCDLNSACNGHATTVTSNGAKDACVCGCQTGYGGDSCDHCTDGYVGYPNCRKCDLSSDCGSKATSVTSVSPWNKCACQCNNQWTGDDCNTCPSQFAGANCDRCKVGSAVYPTCEACSIDKHCSGAQHADSVALSQDQQTCVCTCKNSWTGADCGTCPSQYDASANCGNCQGNMVGYPNCRACSLKDDCNNNAKNVNANAAKTKCECSGEKTGCGNGAQGCACTDPNGCHGPAPPPGPPVAAECNDQWTGEKCDTCPSNYEVSSTTNSCDGCAVGHVNYFACRQCTVANDCNNHADSVTSNGYRTDCVCTCSAGFAGWRCDACAAGHIGYPKCEKCTSADHCSGHAASVTDDGSRTSCSCTCKNKWEGADCSSCPANMDKSQAGDCNRCNKGSVGFPNCRKCTSAQDCSGHAASVDSDRSTCSCTCKAGFTGHDCSSCDTGYVGYPNCRQCTMADCNNAAWKVESNTGNSGCVCHCQQGYKGATCTECAEGFRKVGSYCEACTLASCGNHALSVDISSDGNSCSCNCYGAWTGANCETCPSQYGGTDCDVCAVGYVGRVESKSPARRAAPSVDAGCRQCTVNQDCSGHADSVTDDGSRGACVCTCRNQWTGPKCDQCPPEYDAAQDCGACSAEHSTNGHYPMCGQRCIASKDCNNHGDVEWESATDTCKCNCHHQWSGDTCDTCGSEFGGEDCNKCASSNIEYPKCTQCSSQKHCNGHACDFEGCAVADEEQTSCTCTCADKWTGAQCDQCEARYDQETCSACAAGHINYPLCASCTSESHCRGRAESVEADQTGTHCVCNCAFGWEGADCNVCPEGKKCGEGGFGTVTETHTATSTATRTLTIPYDRCITKTSAMSCFMAECHWLDEEGGGRCISTCRELGFGRSQGVCEDSKGKCSWEGGETMPEGNGHCFANCELFQQEVSCEAEGCEWAEVEQEDGGHGGEEETGHGGMEMQDSMEMTPDTAAPSAEVWGRRARKMETAEEEMGHKKEQKEKVVEKVCRKPAHKKEKDPRESATQTQTSTGTETSTQTGTKTPTEWLKSPAYLHAAAAEDLDQEEENDSSSWLPYVLAALAALLCCCVGAFLLSKKRQQKDHARFDEKGDEFSNVDQMMAELENQAANQSSANVKQSFTNMSDGGESPNVSDGGSSPRSNSGKGSFTLNTQPSMRTQPSQGVHLDLL